MGDYIEFRIGTSSYKNAGICGFAYMLEDYGAIEGTDYEIEQYSLRIKKDYFDKFDIADAYVKAHINKFRESIPLYRLISNLKAISIEETDENGFPKSFKNTQKKITETFKKPKIKSALENLSKTSIDNIKHVAEIEELSTWISQNKKVYCPEKMLRLNELLEMDDVFEYLGMEDVKDKLKVFWDGVAFLNSHSYSNDTKEEYREYFEKPLRSCFMTTDKKEKKEQKCVECGGLTQKKFNIGFIGSIKDAKRKLSNFWNMEENASICPICAFLYTLMPLGFTRIGEDYVFINANSSLPDLIRMNRKQEAIIAEQNKIKVYLYKHITLATLKSYESYPGIQIDLRTAMGSGSNEYKKEQLLLDSNMIQMFHGCKKNFEHLFTKIIKTKDGYYNVYDNLIDSLFSHRTLYYMMDFLYNEGLREGTKPGYLLDLLDIQIYRDNKEKGDKSLNSQDMKKKAYRYGKDMRKSLLKDSNEKDLDNALRGRLYSLSNAVRTGNYKLFIDIIINMYSSNGKQIPKLFIECIDDMDALDVVGRAYLIGLKSVDMDMNKEGE